VKASDRIGKATFAFYINDRYRPVNWAGRSPYLCDGMDCPLGDAPSILGQLDPVPIPLLRCARSSRPNHLNLERHPSRLSAAELLYLCSGGGSGTAQDTRSLVHFPSLGDNGGGNARTMLDGSSSRHLAAAITRQSLRRAKLSPNMTLHVLAQVRSPNGTLAQVGTDPAARQEAFQRVPTFLARYLPR
jgi:hypothetical protein